VGRAPGIAVNPPTSPPPNPTSAFLTLLGCFAQRGTKQHVCRIRGDQHTEYHSEDHNISVLQQIHGWWDADDTAKDQDKAALPLHVMTQRPKRNALDGDAASHHQRGRLGRWQRVRQNRPGSGRKRETSHT